MAINTYTINPDLIPDFGTADQILALDGDDTIIGFTGADSVDGGDGYDKITISATSNDLNTAIDEQLINVEAVDASAMTTTVTINLSLQSEGFTITGGSAADSLTGGSGNDTFVGFTTNDTVIGGGGSKDTITIGNATQATAVSAAADTRIASVEAIDASAMTTTVNINLSVQTEGFTITGGSAADSLTGGSGNDTFVGFTTNDTVIGGGGSKDTITISNATQATAVSAAGDTRIASVEAIDASSMTTGVTISLTLQSEGFSITGGSGNDTLGGTSIAGGDWISGGSGNDTIVGVVGADTIIGGSDTDTISITSAVQATALFALGDDQIVQVEAISASAMTTTVTLNLSKQTTDSVGFSITGGSAADVLTGTSYTDTFVGFAGADTINGGGGTDTLTLSTNTMTTVAGGVSDLQLASVEAINASGATVGVAITLTNQTEAFTITGGAFNDSITGSGGTTANDSISGGGGNDIITGFLGDDTIDGGSGNDTLTLTATTSFTDLNKAQNSQLVSVETISASAIATGVTITLTSQAEGFTITGGAGADKITGGSGADSISAGAGNDFIYGFVGADTIVGSGTDTIFVTSTSDAANISAALNNQLVNSMVIDATTLTGGASISLSVQTEAFTITGGSGNDTLTGGAGSDTFVGFDGADFVTGGGGTADTIVLLSASSVTSLNDASDAQIDTVEAINASAFSTGVTINLSKQTVPTQGFSIIGGAGADVLTGGSGNDTFVGFDGADAINGGLGTNNQLTFTALSSTTDLNNANDAQIVSVQTVSIAAILTGAIVNLSKQLTATEAFTITGGGGNDSITGGSGNDNINGGNGDDNIYGFVGNDTVTGGAGTNTIFILTTSDAGKVSTALQGQIVTVQAVDGSAIKTGVIINLAAQLLEGYSITGGSGNDALTGSTGSDKFIGFVGNDTLIGGNTGTDTIVLYSQSDDLNAANDGQVQQIEAIDASLATAAVKITLTNQTTTTEGFFITGGIGNDSITGGSGNDSISGGAGNDFIYGFVGADTITGSGTDTIVVTSASDAANISAAANSQLVNSMAIDATTLTGGATISLSIQTEGFSITGGSGNDVMTGAIGNDSISAGGGNDKINGFVGADTVNGGDGVDTIVLISTSSTTDLNAASDEQIVQVEAIDAAAITTGALIDLSKQTTTSEGFSITGGSGADAITGGSGNDSISGGTGNDTITGCVGADTIDGGDGNDTLTLTPTSSTSDLNAASDAQLVHVEAINASAITTGALIDLSKQTTTSEGFSITGGAGNDAITGSSGNDSISGGVGNDTIYGFVGADTVDGGGGTDTIVLTATSLVLNPTSDAQIVDVEAVDAASMTAGVTIMLGNQTTANERFSITGGGGADAITGSSGNDSISGGAGNDTIYGFVGADTIDGGGDTDTIILTAESSALNSASDSQIVNLEAVDARSMTAGVTIMLGNQMGVNERFSITGGGGADSITGSSGNDNINAGNGNDAIYGFVGADTIDGGIGADTLILKATSADLNGVADTRLASIESISLVSTSQAVDVALDLSQQLEGFTIYAAGSTYLNRISGGKGGDNIVGGIGAEIITGFVGADFVDGGLGNDKILLSATSEDVNKASDLQINNVEEISAESAVLSVTIDLTLQSEGFAVTGSANGDYLIGGSGNDVFKGFVGADTINGGGGAADKIVLSGTSDELNNASNAQIVGIEAIDAALTTSGVKITLTNQTANTEGFSIIGGSGADTLTGGSGNDTFIGFVNADTVNGGIGTSDTIWLTSAASTIDLNAASDAQISQVEAINASAISTGALVNLSRQTTTSEGFSIFGGAGADFITGGAGNDNINGAAGNDFIYGLLGADTIDGGAGNDTLVLTTISADLDAAGADDARLVSVEAVTAADSDAGVRILLTVQNEAFVITGSAYADTITGGLGADKINAGAGNDTILGFAGADTINGGLDFDTFALSATNLVLNAALDTQLVGVEAVSAFGVTGPVNIALTLQTEGFTITGGSGNDSITGSGGGDNIIAGDGDDVIFGFVGADTISGGRGIDTLVLKATSTALNTAGLVNDRLDGVEAISASTMVSGVVINLSGQLESFSITGGSGSDALTGGAGDDIFVGFNGADIINGFLGADTIKGGSGNDTIILTATSAEMNRAVDGQIVDIEIISAATATTSVSINLALQKSDVFTLVGSNFSDNLAGGGGADYITGRGGDDTFTGFVGADTIDGGSGDADTLVLTGTSTSLNNASNEQLVSVEIISAVGVASAVAVDLSRQEEAFMLTGTVMGDSLTGGNAADMIIGDMGDDKIYGFAGADTVNGGAGNDTIILSATRSELNNAANEQIVGVEAVSAAGTTAGLLITLSRQSEGFTITGGDGNDTFTGGGGADKIVAGRGDDTINGFVDADTIDGGADNDTLVLTTSSLTLNAAQNAQLVNVETIDGSAVNGGVTITLNGQLEGFTLFGGSGDDVLAGGAGADKIAANNGNDTIIGFSGADTVDGGGGVNKLVLTATSATLNSAGDDQLDKVGAVSALGVTAAVSINLSKQTEGFALTGGDGNDILAGGGDADLIIAGAGNDMIIGFSGADTVDGGDGFNTISLTATSATFNRAVEGQIVRVNAVSASLAKDGVEINLSGQNKGFTLAGGGFADMLTGSAGADSISAGAGDDIIKGFVSADTVDGGGGYDTLLLNATVELLNAATNAQLLNVEAVSAAGATAGVLITLSNQSEGFTIIGGDGNDMFTGGAGADSILGGAGNDTIKGFVGADWIDGGAGNDFDTLVLTGTSATLNAAQNGQLLNLEAVSARGATTGLSILLAKQSEGFIITGGAGWDSIAGGGGADVIDAGDGNDTILGFAGADKVDGGEGVDTLVLTATSDDLNAPLASELLHVEVVSASTTTAGVTIKLGRQSVGFSLLGGSGDDILQSGSGADTIIGGAGSDSISAGAGDDVIMGFVGADTVDGGAGYDTIVLTSSATTINPATDDQLSSVNEVSASGLSGAATINLSIQLEGFVIKGGNGNDTISGGKGADTINAGVGNDTIIGFAGNDIIDGGEGTNTILLTASSEALNLAINDQIKNVQAVSAVGATSGVNIILALQDEGFSLTGGAGDDMLAGGRGVDKINAGAGSDTIIGFVGADTVDGGSGSDTISLIATSDDLNAAANAQIINVEVVSAEKALSAVTINLSLQTEGFQILGGVWDDVLSGAAGADVINAGLGKDKIIGFVGADTIDGGEGVDSIMLTSTSATLNSAKDTQIVNVEVISAESALTSVVINLAAQSDKLSIIGGAGSDVLIGGTGNDTLSGGLGVDTLSGGGGADHFVFDRSWAGGNVDTVLDFTPGTDFLDVSLALVSGFAAKGAIQSDQFWSSALATSAHASGDRFIYNTTSGALYYDGDGIGGADAVQIANVNLAIKSAMSYHDFLIV